MSTVMSETNSVEKCPTKVVSTKETKECNKNGLVNGLMYHQMNKNLSSDIKELNESDVILPNNSEPVNDDIMSSVDKSKRRNKKKKHKAQTESDDSVELKVDLNHREENEVIVPEELPTQSNEHQQECIIPSCSNTENGIDSHTLSSTMENLLITEEVGVSDSKKIDFVPYESELQMPMIMKIIQKDLSEPYSIYTYRYFIHNWPKLCFLAMCDGQCVGAIVCKLDLHRKVVRRGYIAMLAVDQNYRKLRIGSTLVQMAIHEMTNGDADEVVLETEVTNKPALKLYEKLGFVRDKRLFRYYLNGVDALRLKLWLR
ncbi:N-alpha-acetyltransferase 30-like isoform X1 [Euwallacea similis]|uniref:N-alpha-acetyltransferase 30-like isoform X1 n=1 Tax=Euwallacea similis TaxID=1736056 RepID=UPI00344B8F6F